MNSEEHTVEIRKAIQDAGYAVHALGPALEAECGPGGTLYDEYAGYMNPVLAHIFARLMAQCPAQMESVLSYHGYSRNSTVAELNDLISQFAYETWCEDSGLSVWNDPMFEGLKEIAQERCRQHNAEVESDSIDETAD